MIPTQPVTSQDIDKLNALLQRAKELHYWKKKRRYFHLITVENFIYHLHKFKDRRTKLKAFNHLQEYLLFITEMDALEELDVHTSRSIYMKFLAPLTNEYDIRLRFVPYISLRTHIVFLSIAEAIAFSCQSALWIKILLALLFFGLSARQSVKQQQKKVYGMFT